MNRQLMYNGSVVNYQRVGAGPTVVLLHGFGESGAVWGFQKDALAKHFQLLIPDLPGSGASQLINDMSMEGFADVVYALLQHEHIVRCVLIGHSMGGYIALAFAERYESLLYGLGLFHSSAYADSSEKKATRQKGIAFIKEQGAAEFLKTTIPGLYNPATKDRKPALIEQQVAAAQGFAAEALVAYYEAMMQRPDRTKLLRQTALPVLFVLGKWDTAVPLQDGLAQCHLPQLAYIHVLHNSGHMGMAEEPERSTALLTDFLSETVGLL